MVWRILQHIDGIREKMDVLGQSGSAIRDVVEGLSAISEQNAASADSTMQAAHGMSDTMTELMNSSENLLALADKLERYWMFSRYKEGAGSCPAGR